MDRGESAFLVEKVCFAAADAIGFTMEKPAFSLVFRPLVRTIALLPKVLLFGDENKKLEFLLCISLTYSYLCKMMQ
jgi:hypothetical protein